MVPFATPFSKTFSPRTEGYFWVERVSDLLIIYVDSVRGLMLEAGASLYTQPETWSFISSTDPVVTHPFLPLAPLFRDGLCAF